MKLHCTTELKSRLTHAAANGSIVAADILREIRSGGSAPDILRGSSNHFGTKRKRSTEEGYNEIKIVFTACTKDVTHENFPDRNNPQAPWYPENRSDLDPATFVKCFKNLREYEDGDLAYFANSIGVDNKVSVKLYTQMSDIHDAYFYYNFAGAQIIVAKDAGNNIMGRAIVWPKAVHLTGDKVEIVASVMDRVYYTHDFVRDLIYDYARSIGIQLRKQANDNGSMDRFTLLNEVPGITGGEHGEVDGLHFYIRVPASKWHKHGAPYMDTFCYLILKPDGSLLLSNKAVSGFFAELRSTSAVATRSKHICPSCNKVHAGNDMICDACKGEIVRQTIFGQVILGGTTEYKGTLYPTKFLRRGRPKPELSLYLQVEKLYRA